MSLLKPAMNQTAYLKAGILGFAGSGKSYTASDMAIGLSKTLGDRKPVAFFDTETGSDYLIPKFQEAGVELLVAKTRTFADLLTFMREAEASCSVAIIDSISHVWTELLEAYTAKLRRRNGLSFSDWGPIKQEWRGFTDVYLNSKMHVILCGRAGYEYDMETNEAGKKELIKTGTKMKAETEMGYEPSLLLEMERVRAEDRLTTGKRSAWIHRCHVLKDRTDRMNGEAIDNPSYESFAPVISFLNIGGEHVGIDRSRSSEDLFDSPEGRSERKRRVEVILDLIPDAVIRGGIGGTAAQAKKDQIEAMRACFGTSSWTAIKAMRLEDMEKGYKALLTHLKLDDDVEEQARQDGMDRSDFNAPLAPEPADALPFP